MRLLTVRRHVFVWARPIAQLAALAFVLSGVALACTCMSRLAQTCDCRC